MANLSTHYLEVDCLGAHCRRGRTFQVVSVAECLPRGTTFQAFIRRLRCQTCGKQVHSAVLIGLVGVRRPQPVRLGLLGPEARD
jgi:hypothetical protein